MYCYFYLVWPHTEQPFGFNDLKTLIHHGGRVNGDFSSHIPIRVFQRLRFRNGCQLLDVYKRQDYMLELRSSGNDIVAPYADKFPGSTFVSGKRPWEISADIALPCATQNELNGEDARQLISHKVKCVVEISNM